MNEELLRRVFKKVNLSDYLDGARQTAEWIRSKATKTDVGMYWNKETDADGNECGRIDMYFGNSGMILFFLQMADASKDEEYLEDAKLGGDYILDQLDKFGIACLSRKKIYLSQYHDGISWSYPVGGISGVCYALSELGKATGEVKYSETALKYTEEIIRNAHVNENGVDWGGKAGISFDSGTILYLLYAAKRFSRPDFLDTAVLGGNAILATGLKAEVGTRFMGIVNIVKAMTGIDDINYDVPNYYYGTSGIAYTFARLYQESGKAEFLEAAREGAAYVKSVAVIDGNAALVPYRIPDKTDLFYLGNCHGVTGTARLYYLLNEITGEQEYWDFCEMLVNGIAASGAPELRSPGYWNCYSFCCGTAGFLDLYAALYLKTKESKWLKLGRRCANVIISEANLSQEGFCWSQAFDRTVPNDVTTDLGLFSGAAGNAASLLQLYMAEKGRAPSYRQPDEPFIIAED